MKTAVVTGSHGFIGSALVEALEANGVGVLECDVKFGYEVETDGYRQIEEDIKNSDVVFHLSCLTQEKAEKKPLKNWRVNIEDTRRVAEICGRHGKRLVFTSSASVYGNQKGALSENSPTMPTSNYGIAKLAAEHFVRKLAPDHAILRLSNVYGPGQTPENPYCGFIGKAFSSVLADTPLTLFDDGRQTRDWTYIDDVVAALLHYAGRFTASAFATANISSGKATSVNRVAAYIAEITDRDFGGLVMPPRSIDNIRQRKLDNTTAWAVGWQPEVSLKEGLRRTYDWWKNYED